MGGEGNGVKERRGSKGSWLHSKPRGGSGLKKIIGERNELKRFPRECSAQISTTKRREPIEMEKNSDINRLWQVADHLSHTISWITTQIPRGYWAEKVGIKLLCEAKWPQLINQFRLIGYKGSKWKLVGVLKRSISHIASHLG